MLLAKRHKVSDPASAARPQRQTAMILAAVLALGTPLLAGCGNGGFKPLYGSSSVGGANVSEKLAQVDVGRVPGRVGQKVRNELIFATTGGGDRLPPEYRLDIAIQEAVTSTLVRQDGDAASQVYNLTANFKLTRLSDNSVALQGTSYGKAGFNRFTSIYSNVRARRSAEDRAASTVSEDLKSRISAFLAGTA